MLKLIMGVVAGLMLVTANLDLARADGETGNCTEAQIAECSTAAMECIEKNSCDDPEDCPPCEKEMRECIAKCK